MQQQTTYERSYLEAFEAFHSNGAKNDPAYVRSARQQAIQVFGKIGFPTARRGNEKWKYTDFGVVPTGTVRGEVAASSGQGGWALQTGQG
jgi:hypothetical protein